MPTPLASIFSTIDSYKRRGADVVSGLLDSPLDVLKNQLVDVGNASKERADQTGQLFKTTEGLFSFDRSKWSPQAAAAADALAGDALGAIAGATVYHGTPHQFGKFDSSKIGTGEGAQVYGHGIYLAENPAVAQQYARQLGTTRPTVDGAVIANTDPRYGALQAINSRGYDKALADAEQWLKAGLGKQADVDAIRALKGAKIGSSKTGQVYSVDLPDETIAKMLDYDAPVPEELRQRLSAKAMEQWGNGATGTSGEHLLKEITREFQGGAVPAPAAAAEWLRQQGVPGVKYRDQFSRAIATEPRQLQGSGKWSVVFPGGKVQLFDTEAAARAAYAPPTSNFVVFPGEESALTILDRNSNLGLGQ